MKVLSFILGTSSAMLVALSASVAAHEPGAHVHGVASLQVAIDGKQVSIDMDSPLDNIVGFEHAAKTDKDRQAIKAMAAKFHQGEKLFVLTPAAQCTLQSVNLNSAVIDPTLLAKEGAGPTSPNSPAAPASPTPPSEVKPTAAGKKSAAVHGDLEATLSFVCANPTVLKELDVRLFDAFPHLKRLNAALVGPRGQTSAKLTAAKTQLSW